MERRLEAEWLDELPAGVPEAARSRRDLRLLNALMGNAKGLALALAQALPGNTARQLVELGAGDGRLLLNVASRLGKGWRGTQLTLVDRQGLLEAETCEAYARLGWSVEAHRTDVFDWFARQAGRTWDGIVANLFLHHFNNTQLAELFRQAAERAQSFVALDPRRSVWGLTVSRCVGLIGCNRVTRHDARVSVQAGFAGQELSRLWPARGGWSLTERRTGLFGHLFVARNQVGRAVLRAPGTPQRPAQNCGPSPPSAEAPHHGQGSPGAEPVFENPV